MGLSEFTTIIISCTFVLEQTNAQEDRESPAFPPCRYYHPDLKDLSDETRKIQVVLSISNLKCQLNFTLPTLAPLAMNNDQSLIPSSISGHGYKVGPVCVSLCVCVCQLVSALTAQPFELRT